TDPALPYRVTVDNLSNWHAGGYQDFLHAKDRAERLKARHDEYFKQAQENPAGLASGALHFTTIGLCELMDDISLSNRSDKTDSDKICRVANTIARMSRHTLNIQESRDRLRAQGARFPPLH
ncbi:MAG: hypothetical protein JWO95_2557, partial [Verrucomicrobiales bacterium]|nr:hypothetical protein [Verrucomicrobiales bacterium]